MICKAIKTRPLLPPQDNLFDVLEAVPKLQEQSILFIASKIVAIHEGRTIKVDEIEKDDLIYREADYVISKTESPGEHATLTITDGSVISSAGIDSSNAQGHYILWPKRSTEIASEVKIYLQERDNVREFGVVIVDSHSTLLRRGATGFSLASAGIKPLKSYVGKPDIFGEPMNVSVMNVVDNLAGAAVATMGEGNEQTPLVLITDVPQVEFTDLPCSDDVKVAVEQDIHYPLLRVFTNLEREP